MKLFFMAPMLGALSTLLYHMPERWLALYQKEKVSPAASATASFNDAGNAFNAGQIGMVQGWLGFLGTFSKGIGPDKFGLAPTWEPGLAQTRLEQLSKAGVRTVCFHEHWVPYQSYPHVADADRPRLKSLVEGMHQSNLNLLLYMSRQFADNCPDDGKGRADPQPSQQDRQRRVSHVQVAALPGLEVVQGGDDGAGDESHQDAPHHPLPRQNGTGIGPERERHHHADQEVIAG